MTRAQRSRRISGSANPRWQRDKIISSQGYVLVRVGADHPLADSKGYAYEHLLVWVAAGNRVPRKTQCIHHRNEDKQDNRYGNLQLVNRKEHTRLHIATRARDERGRWQPTTEPYPASWDEPLVAAGAPA